VDTNALEIVYTIYFEVNNDSHRPAKELDSNVLNKSELVRCF